MIDLLRKVVAFFRENEPGTVLDDENISRDRDIYPVSWHELVKLHEWLRDAASIYDKDKKDFDEEYLEINEHGSKVYIAYFEYEQVNFIWRFLIGLSYCWQLLKPADHKVYTHLRWREDKVFRIVNVEEVREHRARLREINRTSLERILWVEDNQPLDIPVSRINDFLFTGMANMDFIDTECYKFGMEEDVQ